MTMKQSSRRTFLKNLSLGLTGVAAAEWLPVREAFAQKISALNPNSDFAALRSEYALSPHITYFNHASIGTTPKSVLWAHQHYLELCESNPHQYMWGEPWEVAREQTRQLAAEYLTCDVNEIALTHNTTEGFNLLAAGLPLRAGDEVLFSSMNHSGASVCWQHYARQKGFAVKRFAFPIREVAGLAAQDVVDLYAAQITQKTKVLVFPHIDNLVGMRYPVREMTEMARAKGVRYIAVDGAQAVGMIPVKLQELGVDFYATSPHKWLQSPKGLGLLYVRKAIQQELSPMWVTWGQQRWADSARRFEDYGTRNLAAVVTLGDAIMWQQRLDELGKSARLQALHAAFYQKAEAAGNVIWRSPRDWLNGSSVYTVEIKGHDSFELAQRLGEVHGFVLRPFRSENWNAVRISPHVFNEATNFDRFFQAVG